MKTKKAPILFSALFFSILFIFAFTSCKIAYASGECSACDSSAECDTGMTCADCRGTEALRSCPGAGCSDYAGRCVPDSSGDGGGSGGGNDCAKIGGICVSRTSDGLCSDGRVGVDYCDSSSQMCCGPSGGNGGSGGSGNGLIIPQTGLPNPPGGIEQILANFLDWILAIVGIIALISFVVSGIQYFYAAGDDKNMETAKRNLTYSIIGIIVALSGFVIIQAIDAMLRGSYFGF